VDSLSSSYDSVSNTHGDDMGEEKVTRRSLRSQQKKSRSQGWVRKGAAAVVLLGLTVGTYGFVSTTAEAEDANAALTSFSGADPLRSAPPSRGLERSLLEDEGDHREITVTVDGEEIEINTRARTLADALAEAGIEVGFYDEVDHPLNGEPTDTSITRITESVETVEEEIPYKTKKNKTDSLTKGTERVETRGEVGQRTATKRVWRKEGEVIAEEVLAEAVGKEPVDEVVAIGTRPKPQPARGSSSSSSASSSSSGSSSSSSSSTPSSGSPRAIAQDMLSEYGWGQDQWSCLNSLWQRESGWNPQARNPSSGAFGIPQALPGSKMASAGSDWQTNPATQIRWGLGYIKSRYGSPCGAWAKSQAVGWY